VAEMIDGMKMLLKRMDYNDFQDKICGKGTLVVVYMTSSLVLWHYYFLPCPSLQFSRCVLLAGLMTQRTKPRSLCI
jgi:hypothetical protein